MKEAGKSLSDLEFWEYVIKPALGFKGTPEDLGYKEIKTPHGSLWVSENNAVPENEIWAKSAGKLYKFRINQRKTEES